MPGVKFLWSKKKYYYFSKRKGKYFYTFNHFYSEKSSKKSKIAQIYYYDPQSAKINVQSPQSESTPRRLTLTKSLSCSSYQFSHQHFDLLLPKQQISWRRHSSHARHVPLNKLWTSIQKEPYESQWCKRWKKIRKTQQSLSHAHNGYVPRPHTTDTRWLNH